MNWICGIALLSIGFLSGASCLAADQSAPLKIAGLKPSYSLNDPVTIEVTNLSLGTVSYGIGVLIQLNGKWEEFVTNLGDHDIVEKAFRIRKIAGGKAVSFTWSPGDVGKSYPVQNGRYRFYLAYSTGPADEKQFGLETHQNIGSEVGKENQQLIFSEPFEVKVPAGKL